MKTRLTNPQLNAQRRFIDTLRRLGISKEPTWDEIISDAVDSIIGNLGSPDSLFLSPRAIEEMSKEFNGLSDVLDKQDDSQSN